MFQKILIANRGEIACRVIASAKKMGIKTVAVYSEVDKNAQHVAWADEAYLLGPAPVADSYLQGEKIIDIALKSGAEAIHPGYGFLSENADFVQALTDVGLTFIGPSADAIRAMGLKDSAKHLMEQAGVPVVPGYHGDNQDPNFLAKQAEKIGYPILIKARAGGGGKGMRLVESANDFKTALEGASREALASFGDGACLIEKYINCPRHIEVQVFGDTHGNAVHFYERDCSLQRRYQKVIEEAPAPDMPQAIRDAMGKSAIQVVKAIHYTGAGTVEFIVDGSTDLRTDGFWFMEMNTRLQVEHPISELITGYDFVALQLRVAYGEPLPCIQSDISIDGWAFEARVYAEDVPKGFLPATGRITHMTYPKNHTAFESGTVRIDSGVRQGDDISPWYDSMIAKVICYGKNRQIALNQLQQALCDYQVGGCTTNMAFLHALTQNADFRLGKVHTGLIEQHKESLIAVPSAPPYMVALASIGGLGLLSPVTDTDPWATLRGWRHWDDGESYITLTTDTDRYNRCVQTKGRGVFVIKAEDTECCLDILQIEGDKVQICHNDTIFWATIVCDGTNICVNCDGNRYTFGIDNPLYATHTDDVGGNVIVSPMPGIVRAIYVKNDDAVRQGDNVIVIEAMKMEHTLTAPCDGIITEIMASVGDSVDNGGLLIQLERQND